MTQGNEGLHSLYPNWLTIKKQKRVGLESCLMKEKMIYYIKRKDMYGK